jgi:hypothetical protein
MESHNRTAFTAALVLDRRQQASASSITAVGVDQAGQRLYLGLEDGVLEEHAILRSELDARASLAARKHAAKKVRRQAAGGGPAAAGATATALGRQLQTAPHSSLQAILGIHHLSEIGLVVLLSEDGSVLLLDAETLEGRPLPLRWVPACC